MKIAILVPFYNEKNNLASFIREWENYLKKKGNLYKNLLFVFIDDGSTDGSSKIIRNKIERLKFIILKKKNSGHGDTCKFGYTFIMRQYKKYKYNKNDIVKNDNASIWKVITNRYNNSGYPRLFEE